LMSGTAPLNDSHAERPLSRTPGPVDEELSYWRRQLATAPATTSLPSSAEQSSNGHAGAKLIFPMAGGIITNLRRVGASRAFTPFAALAASVVAGLAAASGSEDIVVGVPVDRRVETGEWNSVGLNVNTLPLRVHISPQDTIDLAISKVQRELFDLYDHSSVTLSTIAERLDLARTPGRSLLQ
jgi:hypothetical protein